MKAVTKEVTRISSYRHRFVGFEGDETLGSACITTEYQYERTSCKPRKFSQLQLTDTRGGKETVSFSSRKLTLAQKQSRKTKRKKESSGKEIQKTCRKKDAHLFKRKRVVARKERQRTAYRKRKNKRSRENQQANRSE